MLLGKGQLVALEGRLQTRQWEDDSKLRLWFRIGYEREREARAVGRPAVEFDIGPITGAPADVVVERRGEIIDGRARI